MEVGKEGEPRRELRLTPGPCEPGGLGGCNEQEMLRLKSGFLLTVQEWTSGRDPGRRLGLVGGCVLFTCIPSSSVRPVDMPRVWLEPWTAVSECVPAGG